MAPQAAASVTPSDSNAKPPEKAKTGQGKGGSLEKAAATAAQGSCF